MSTEERRKGMRDRYAAKREKEGKPYRPGQIGRHPKPPAEKAERKPSYSLSFDPDYYDRIALAGGTKFIRGLINKALPPDKKKKAAG